MIYQVLQIMISDAEVDMINANGFDSVPKQVAKMSMSFVGKGKTATIAKKALQDGFYTHVANIEANSLDGVFQVGNIGPEENINRFAPMHSVSVGDVIVNQETAEKFVVASYGFEEVA